MALPVTTRIARRYTINYGGYDDFAGAPPASGPTNEFGGDNLNLGKPNSIRGDPRTLRLSLGYRF